MPLAEEDNEVEEDMFIPALREAGPGKFIGRPVPVQVPVRRTVMRRRGYHQCRPRS